MNNTQRTGFLIGKFFAPLFLTVFGVAKLLKNSFAKLKKVLWSILRPTFKVAIVSAAVLAVIALIGLGIHSIATLSVHGLLVVIVFILIFSA